MPIISFDAKKWSGRSYGAGEKYWRCRSMSFDVAAGRVPAVLRAGRLLGAAARVHAGIPGQLRGQRTTSVPPGNAFNSSCLFVCFFVFAVSLPDPSSNTSACVVRPRSRMLMTDRFRRGTLRSASWLVVRAVCFLFCFQIVERDQRGRKCFFFLARSKTNIDDFDVYPSQNRMNDVHQPVDCINQYLEQFNAFRKATGVR